jgi:hypothetical protein
MLHMCVYTHSRFIENHPIRILEDGPLISEVVLSQQARFKYIIMHTELQNFSWIKNLNVVNSEELLDEFILLFKTLGDISLNDQKDSILWKWTTLGNYFAASAYDIQFLGAYPKFSAHTIWKAKTEPKCQFFALLVMWKKVPTADNLMKKSWSL